MMWLCVVRVYFIFKAHHIKSHCCRCVHRENERWFVNSMRYDADVRLFFPSKIVLMLFHFFLLLLFLSSAAVTAIEALWPRSKERSRRKIVLCFCFFSYLLLHSKFALFWSQSCFIMSFLFLIYVYICIYVYFFYFFTFCSSTSTEALFSHYYLNEPRKGPIFAIWAMQKKV